MDICLPQKILQNCMVMGGSEREEKDSNCQIMKTLVCHVKRAKLNPEGDGIFSRV